MANLRIISVVVNSSTAITATFTSPLNEDIGIGNIAFSSQTPGVPVPAVISVNVVGAELNITTQPLTPLAAYFIIFQSTATQLFNSINGNSVLLNDNITNQQLIIATIDNSNPIQQYLINFLRNNVYNLNPPSVISSIIQVLSTELSEALYAIRQCGNENYLSFTVIDESKIRGTGAFDRLDEESSYEVLRVGKTPTNENIPFSNTIISFPPYPISVQATQNQDILILGSQDISGIFNLNSFTLNLTQQNVIILNSVSFIYLNSSVFNYDITKFGYQILDSQYDPNFAFTYLQLENNQIKLNSKILNDPNFSTNNIEKINVSYQYKDTGKIIDPTSIVIDTILPSGREVLPPLENIFTLNHAPIVNKNGKIGTVGDITFSDPNGFRGSLHPAFLYEIAFSLSYLPATPGEYAVDYNTGNVYVFGADFNQTGTGAEPPIAIYSYLHTFSSEVDYVYDVDILNLVALPNGSLTNSPATVNYNYEEVLAAGIDYIADVHIEALNENIQNRLIALNAIRPLNSPITDVFRILNQTTGEVYKALRWNDNTIYFNYSKAPNIEEEIGELATFQEIFNSVLFVNSVNEISFSENIFVILLNDNNIIAATQDCIGSVFNSSISFSERNVFVQEIYFDDNISIEENNSRLNDIGDYQVDYINGIIYLLTSSTQTFSIGTISYRRGYISPQFPAVISVENIYYQLSILNQPVKTFNYINFSNGSILPSSFDIANEGFLNGNIEFPYQILSGVVGTFSLNAVFVPGITNYIKFVRSLFEYTDLLFNTEPINFVNASIPNNKNITVSSLNFSEYHTVKFDGTNYYIIANTNLLYQSINITFNFSVIRVSDNKNLWNNSGVVVLGKPFKLILPGINSPNVGDSVLLTYSYVINDLSRIIVDYNKGDYFIDYSYLADEIIISYEYGDNQLDFRQSNALNAGDTYFVSYRVGALRTALLNNFGTLIDIPILNSLDVSFERERYRDALMAAMQSFTQGPTKTSLSNIVNTIVHTPPEIIESAFNNWSLGSSLLTPIGIETTGNFSLVPAVYDNGVLINDIGQTITFPISSNLRLEEGTLSCWILPQWNGIDNQSELTFTIYKDGYIIPENEIFIGSAGTHPIFDGYSFIVEPDKLFGKPNQSKNGIFIYIAPDQSQQFNRWYIDIFDGYSDGYLDGYYSDGYLDGYFDGYCDGYKNYNISIKTSGIFYDVKSNQIIKPATDSIFSGTNTISYNITNACDIISGITFVADYRHYIFDFGKEKLNRFSLYKDESGYINFSIIDKHKNTYSLSADVSNWIILQSHYISIAWELNTANSRDEMHLFIDGTEVSNIIKYNSKIQPYLHEKFRTIDPEEIVGLIPFPIVGSHDLTTTVGSNLVSSSLNFSALGITTGNILYINEQGFSQSGYNITFVNGNTLSLSTTLPLSTTNSTFSINTTTFNVNTDIDLFPNIAVSLLHKLVSGSDLSTMMGSNIVSSISTNFTNLNVLPGSIININSVGFSPTYIILAVNNHSLTLDDNMPSSISSGQYFIYPNDPIEIPGVNAVFPSYSISRNSIGAELTITNDAQVNDIVIINTLGIDFKYIKRKYYVWGSSSNIIMTKLPSPTSLDSVEITHIIVDGYIMPAGQTNSGNISTDQPSLSDNGRTLSVYLTGENIDFSSPPTVFINGNVSETLTFNQIGIQNTTNKFSTINYINISCTPISLFSSSAIVYVKELFPITMAENSITVPIINYSYVVLAGNSLSGSGNILTDPNNFFSFDYVNNYIVISSPIGAVGTYKILDVNTDHHTIVISGSLSSFSSGIYQILNTTTFRSGLQNGFFTFENANVVGAPYNLVQGLYEFNYPTYLSIPLNTTSYKGYIGTDINGNNPVNAIIDEFLIVGEKLTDTRIGETALVNQETITKDFNSLVALRPNSNTLMLLHFDSFPFTNDSKYYITNNNQSNYILTSFTINDNFGKSIVIKNNPILIDNTGILDTKNQGTIELWISPLFDTMNDNFDRYYFDASSITLENATSMNAATVILSRNISEVLSVRLALGDQKQDYFDGGKINGNTIFLNKRLPIENTPVVVEYIPAGVFGDRISIVKDKFGYINFNIFANDILFSIRAPVFWEQHSWHRIKTIYKMNSGVGSDIMQLYIDGYEYGNVLFAQENAIFGQDQIFGSSGVGVNNTFSSAITFRDNINNFFIGGNYLRNENAAAIFNNIRISDIARMPFSYLGENIDVNYNSNLNVAVPVEQDLYSRLLLNFFDTPTLTNNFAMLNSESISDITIDIYDALGIVGSLSSTVGQTLTEILNTLKPAGSRLFLNFTPEAK